MLPSGQCAQLVREWLGSTDEADSADPMVMAPDPFTSRPARCARAKYTVACACADPVHLHTGHRLGLGAKFLSHVQATALSPGEQSLKLQIKGGAKRAAAPRSVGMSQPAKRRAAVQQSAELEGSCSEEEESRTSVFRCMPSYLPHPRSLAVAPPLLAGPRSR